MNPNRWKTICPEDWFKTIILSLFSFLFVSCGHLDPAKVDVDIAKTHPVPKVTNYTEALMDLGLMTKIYGTQTLKVQSIPIYDNTGSSVPTGGEIPKDISEIVKSVLNSIGGNLIYIPYDPSFIQNQMVTGYSNFQKKLIPDVVVSGGITEFDRGLETREKNTDASSRFTYEGLPDYLPELENEVPYPSKELHFRFGKTGKVGLARITLDFNLLDFQSMSGIPRMNTVNTIEVQKAMGGKELGISIFAQAFGRKGKIKKVQGRHAAIRLLVELSMIQIIGRQLVLPYWNLLGDDTLPDTVVLDSARAFYQSLDQSQKIAFTQQQLFLHGYDITIDGVSNKNTVAALRDFFQTKRPPLAPDIDNFMKIWSSIPITSETLQRRRLVDAYFAKQQEEQAALEQQQRSRSDRKAKQNKSKPKKEEFNSIPKEAMDQLLRMLEEKKRS
jgi:hypothetical protein